MATATPALPLRDRSLSSRQLPGYRAGHRAPAGAGRRPGRGPLQGANREAARLTAEEIASLGPEPDPLVLGGGRPQPETTSAACSRVSPNVMAGSTCW